MKLIDKDALVAEIEKIEADAVCQYKSDKSRYAEGVLDITHRIKGFIDTIEVKEVDIEKELNDYGYHYDYVSLADRKELVDFAKHFFELGMAVSNKAQKGE